MDGARVELPRLRHRHVTLPAGRHRVELSYVPPGLGAGCAASAVALLAVGWLMRPRRA